jgi:hypothetical protein
MMKIVAAAFLATTTFLANAQCLNSDGIRLVGDGRTLEGLTADDQRFREEAKKANIPYLGLHNGDLEQIKPLYKNGDLIYSYEVTGGDGKVFAGGTALVRAGCIILRLRGWIA